MDTDKNLWRSYGWYTSSESDDSNGGKSDFDEEYYRLKPPCNPNEYDKSKIVIIKPNQFLDNEETKVKSSQVSTSEPIVSLEQLCSNIILSRSNERMVQNAISMANDTNKSKKRKSKKDKLKEQPGSNETSSCSDKSIVVDNSNLILNDTNKTEIVIKEKKKKNPSESNLMKNNSLKPPISDKCDLLESTSSIDSDYEYFSENDEFYEYYIKNNPDYECFSMPRKKLKNIQQINSYNIILQAIIIEVTIYQLIETIFQEFCKIFF